MHTCTHAYMHTCIHVNMHTCIHVNKCINTLYILVFTFCWICTYTKMKNKLCTVYTCVCIDTYKHMHIHACVYTCTYAFADLFFSSLSLSRSLALSPSLFCTHSTTRLRGRTYTHIHARMCTNKVLILERIWIEWVMSHVNESRHTWRCHVACRFCYWSELESKTAGFASKCR